MEFDTILFFGKPGSGKGTQAKLLAEATGYPTVSSGDLFRALAKEDSYVGQKMSKELAEGLLMPDWFAAYLFQKTILALQPGQGIILDGFGRKVPEAKIVLDVLKWTGRNLRAVHVKVSDEEIVARLAKRGETSGRPEDFQVEKRLEEYRTFTEPCLEIFRDAGVMVEVNGEGEMDAIQSDIRAALGIK